MVKMTETKIDCHMAASDRYDRSTLSRRFSTFSRSFSKFSLPPRAKLNFPKAKTFIIFRVQEFFSSGPDAAAGAAAGAAATGAASAAAFVFATVFTVVATVAAAEAAAVAAAVAAAPAAASVSEEKDSWTLNIMNGLVFGKLVLHVSVVEGVRLHNFTSVAFGLVLVLGKLAHGSPT